jgi:hypothetical protein
VPIRPAGPQRPFPFERQNTRGFEVASLIRQQKLRCGQLHAPLPAQLLISFFLCAGRSVATLDVRHLDAVPASILTAGTIWHATACQIQVSY